MDLQDEDAGGLSPEFNQTRPPEPQPVKVTVPLEIDGDLLQWFQAQGRDWQQQMNGVLRFYMDTSQTQDAQIEAARQRESAFEPGL